MSNFSFIEEALAEPVITGRSGGVLVELKKLLIETTETSVKTLGKTSGKTAQKSAQKTAQKSAQKTAQKSAQKSTETRNNDGVSVGENVGENVGEKQLDKVSKKILFLLKNEPELSIARLSKNCAVTTRTIERKIKKLQDDSQLKRIGPDKGGHWEVIDE